MFQCLASRLGTRRSEPPLPDTACMTEDGWRCYKEKEWVIGCVNSNSGTRASQCHLSTVYIGCRMQDASTTPQSKICNAPPLPCLHAYTRTVQYIRTNGCQRPLLEHLP